MPPMINCTPTMTRAATSRRIRTTAFDFFFWRTMRRTAPPQPRPAPDMRFAPNAGPAPRCSNEPRRPQTTKNQRILRRRDRNMRRETKPLYQSRHAKNAAADSEKVGGETDDGAGGDRGVQAVCVPVPRPFRVNQLAADIRMARLFTPRLRQLRKEGLSCQTDQRKTKQRAKMGCVHKLYRIRAESRKRRRCGGKNPSRTVIDPLLPSKGGGRGERPKKTIAIAIAFTTSIEASG